MRNTHVSAMQLVGTLLEATIARTAQTGQEETGRDHDVVTGRLKDSAGSL